MRFGLARPEGGEGHRLVGLEPSRDGTDRLEPSEVDGVRPGGAQAEAVDLVRPAVLLEPAGDAAELIPPLDAVLGGVHGDELTRGQGDQ